MRVIHMFGSVALASALVCFAADDKKPAASKDKGTSSASPDVSNAGGASGTAAGQAGATGSSATGQSGSRRGASNATQTDRGSRGAATADAAGGQQGAAGAAGASASGGLRAQDRQFLMKAASAGMMEVELGKIAVQKAQNQEVKSFGQRMIDDHSKANQELQTVASTAGITLPAEMRPEHRAHVSKLEKLEGAAFDKAYMRDMLTDHKKDIAEFERASKSPNQAIAGFASSTVPTLRQHLQMAMDANTAVSGASNVSQGQSTGGTASREKSGHADDHHGAAGAKSKQSSTTEKGKKDTTKP